MGGQSAGWRTVCSVDLETPSGRAWSLESHLDEVERCHHDILVPATGGAGWGPVGYSRTWALKQGTRKHRSAGCRSGSAAGMLAVMGIKLACRDQCIGGMVGGVWLTGHTGHSLPPTARRGPPCSSLEVLLRMGPTQGGIVGEIEVPQTFSF